MPEPKPRSEQPDLEQIFSSIDKKLSLNLASEITDKEIDQVYNYYLKEKIRFNQDQSQFIKPKRSTTNSSTKATIERLKNIPLKLF